jgi:REP element-mobilizing transposase RayT
MEAMARPLRIEFAGALYHITSRGNARGSIYLNDSERHSFLQILGSTCDRHDWLCHAYCLMTNHYHLLIETQSPTLSKGMKSINGSYTQDFNKRHKRVGHVFQGRFKAILVESNAYLLELARIDPDQSLQDIPRPQKRSPPKPLAYYQSRYTDAKKAMAAAYLGGHYTLTEVGQQFGVSYATVSRAVKAFGNAVNCKA